MKSEWRRARVTAARTNTGGLAASFYRERVRISASGIGAAESDGAAPGSRPMSSTDQAKRDDTRVMALFVP